MQTECCGETGTTRGRQQTKKRSRNAHFRRRTDLVARGVDDELENHDEGEEDRGMDVISKDCA
jgi:hypothetical protein